MFDFSLSIPSLALRKRHSQTPLPVALQANLWIDPSDPQTVFTDVARTTAVTASGDVVGAIEDKSGFGNHLVAANTLSKPEWDGVDGWSNDASSGTGLALAQDLLVREVFISCEYDDGIESSFEEYNTLLTDLSGITSASANRIFGRRYDSVLHNQAFEVAKPNQSFGATVLPLSRTVLRVRRNDGAAWPIGGVGTNNNSSSGRSWRGTIGKLVAFPDALSAADAAEVVSFLS